MNFYFIDENNAITHITGSNKTIYDLIISVTSRQKTTTTGFIGAIDNSNRIRASLLFSYVDSKVLTKLGGFIRKYAALGVLEKHAESLKAESIG